MLELQDRLYSCVINSYKETPTLLRQQPQTNFKSTLRTLRILKVRNSCLQNSYSQKLTLRVDSDLKKISRFLFVTFRNRKPQKAKACAPFLSKRCPRHNTQHCCRFFCRCSTPDGRLRQLTKQHAFLCGEADQFFEKTEGALRSVALCERVNAFEHFDSGRS